MSKKEEKAKEYRLKTVLNTERYLEGGSNIEKAYIAGWDAALKDLQSRFPKWKKEAPSATTLYVKYKDYYIEVKAVEWLFDLLGKEEQL